MSLNIKRHINTRVIFRCPPMDCLQQWLIVTQIQHQLLYQRVTKRQKKHCQFGPMLPFCPFRPVTCRYLVLKPIASKHASGSLCAHPVIVFSPFQSHLTFVFPSASNGRCFSSFFLEQHQTTQSFDSPIFVDQCSCSDFDKLSHTTTVGPSSSPRNFRSSRPADWKTEGLTLLLRFQVSWLCWSFAVLVVLTMWVINTQLLPFPPCA